MSDKYSRQIFDAIRRGEAWTPEQIAKFLKTCSEVSMKLIEAAGEPIVANPGDGHELTIRAGAVDKAAATMQKAVGACKDMMSLAILGEEVLESETYNNQKNVGHRLIIDNTGTTDEASESGTEADSE